MIYGPYRAHASHAASTSTRTATYPWDEERARVSKCVHVAPRKPRGVGPCYFATALEAALRTWLSGRKA